MSSSRSSNSINNPNDINEQINYLSKNLNPQGGNNTKTHLMNVYSNITSPKSASNSVQKLSELEEKLKSIKLGNNIDNYYQSLNTENQAIIPQMRRMELLQRKVNLLQNSNAQNSKALQEILEIEMKERLRYPKYTIIQNTPLTPHEEIMNKIIQKKLGPGAGYSMNYPTVVFKNQNEINEMRDIQNSQNENNGGNNTSNNNYNNFGNNNRVMYQSPDNNPVTVKMIKEIQKEILGLRKTVSEFKSQLKEMKENFKLELEKDINSNKLLIEMIRKVIEEGGDNKLKSSVEKNFDKKEIDLNEIKTDLQIFKTEELNDIINKEINKYDKKMSRIIEKMQNDLTKIMNDKIKLDKLENNNLKNKFVNNLFEIKSKKSSKNSKQINSSKNENNDNENNKEEKTNSKKTGSKNTDNSKLNKKTKTNEINSEDSEEEEEEEEENEDYSNSKTSGNKSTKKSKSRKS